MSMFESPGKAPASRPGAEYVSLNPGCLDDRQQFPYNYLKKLCAELGLSGAGRREELVNRLRGFHEERFNEEKDDDEPGSNFHLVPVALGSPESAARQLGQSTKTCPSLMSPLVSRPRRRPCGAPVGILSPPSKTRRTPRASRLRFSAFNGVKVIPDRHEDRAAAARQAYLDAQAAAEAAAAAVRELEAAGSLPEVGGRRLGMDEDEEEEEEEDLVEAGLDFSDDETSEDEYDDGEVSFKSPAPGARGADEAAGADAAANENGGENAGEAPPTPGKRKLFTPVNHPQPFARFV